MRQTKIDQSYGEQVTSDGYFTTDSNPYAYN